MPPRIKLTNRQLTASEFPILPFLAPRVFTPWPQYCARRLAASDAVLDGDNGHTVAHRTASAFESPRAQTVQERDADAAAMSRIIASMDSRSRMPVHQQNLHSATFGSLQQTTPVEVEQHHQRSDHNTAGNAFSHHVYDNRSGNNEDTRSSDTSLRYLSVHDPAYRLAYESTWGAPKPRGSRSTTMLNHYSPEQEPTAQTAYRPVTTTGAVFAGRSPDGPHKPFRRLSFTTAKRILPAETSHSADVLSTTRHVGQHRKPLRVSMTAKRQEATKRQGGILLQTRRRTTRTVANFQQSSQRAPVFSQRRVRLHNRSAGTACELVRVQSSAPFSKPFRPLKRDLTYSDSDLIWSRAVLWTELFWKLSEKFDARIPHYTKIMRKSCTLQGPGVPEFKIICRELTEATDPAHVRSYWQNLPVPKKLDQLWVPVMLHILKYHPNSALKVLLGTHNTDFVPGYAIGDCLEYIVEFHARSQRGTSSRDMLPVLAGIEHILLHNKNDSIILTQRTMYKLSQILDGAQLKRFYFLLVKFSQNLHENTSLHIIHSLAQAGETQTAIEELTALHNRGANFSNPKIESVCAVLLQRRYRNGGTEVSDSDLFSHMLDMGLQPNISFHNILLKNSIAAKDPETAWRIHDMMKDIRVQPDEYTYSMLLNDAKLRGDELAVQRVIKSIQKESIRNAHIVTDLLHSMILTFKAKLSKPGYRLHGRKPAFPLQDMMELYKRFFDFEPLQLLLSDDVETLSPSRLSGHEQEPSIKPPTPTLAVMISAILRFSSMDKVALYQRFRRLVLQGHPAILPLVENTVVYDSMIMSLSKDEQSLQDCTKIISDMVSSKEEPTILGRLSTQSGGLTPRCIPSVRTWSIMLKAFLSHRQPRAAEKVLELMETRGVKPNQVTWNTLVGGYAKMQDIPNTVRAIKRLEDDGFHVDGVIMKALHRIENRGTLKKAIEMMSAERSGNREQDLAMQAQRTLDAKHAAEIERLDALMAVAENAEDERGDLDVNKSS